MIYPISPFENYINTKILLNNESKYNDAENSTIQNTDFLTKLTAWLCTTPAVTSYRVNTLSHGVDSVMPLIVEEIVKSGNTHRLPKIETCRFPDVILLNKWDTQHDDLKACEREVVVDIKCAAAVLRGSHIFAPGVIGMSSGIAVEITNTISGCPSIGTDFLPQGSAILQNLPSVICVYVLNPQPGDVILDMCASPGNKTTHIAALMKNTGILIAIDKTLAKTALLKRKCEEFKAHVHTYQADSTKIFDINRMEDVLCGPPFASESFDRILLDAPCSALGQRPQLRNNISLKVLQSFVPLQRKLFENAVHLLKVNGRLVYSTCTITVGENENMVAWALKTFNCLELVKSEPYLGGEGLEQTQLNNEQRKCVQRFGPDQEIDSVGFFIACFTKKRKCI